MKISKLKSKIKSIYQFDCVGQGCRASEHMLVKFENNLGLPFGGGCFVSLPHFGLLLTSDRLSIYRNMYSVFEADCFFKT